MARSITNKYILQKLTKTILNQKLIRSEKDEMFI